MCVTDIFTDIYRKNRFGGTESLSGPGSGCLQTKGIVHALPKLCNDLEVSTILDIPCGDYYWMRHVNFNAVKYIGADIVEELILKNKIHENKDVRFCRLDLISDKLPKADLILCRDCLVHFSYSDVFLAIKNICRSTASYLLTTTFPDRERNVEIKTGEWWPINLEVEPFNFPKPDHLVVEGCTEVNGEYGDKSLGLWRISRIEK